MTDRMGTANFRTTHWSLVLSAADKESPQSAAALEEVCRAYWHPLYAFARRQGHEADAAQDLIQEFFLRLLAKDFLEPIDPAKGRFRSFLLMALKRFLANEHDHAQRQKRGGGCSFISLDEQTDEERFQFETAHNLNPEKFYERRWAQALMEQVLVRVRLECDEAGKLNRFEHLKQFLAADGNEASYAEVALNLGMTDSAVKSAIHRLRQRYGAVLREEIAKTVAGPELVEQEIRDLFIALQD